MVPNRTQRTITKDTPSGCNANHQPAVSASQRAPLREACRNPEPEGASGYRQFVSFHVTYKQNNEQKAATLLNTHWA